MKCDRLLGEVLANDWPPKTGEDDLPDLDRDMPRIVVTDLKSFQGASQGVMGSLAVAFSPGRKP